MENRTAYRAIDVVKELLAKEGKTQYKMAEAFGVTRQAMHKQLCLTKGDIKVDVFARMLDWLGYQIYTLPKGYEVDEKSCTKNKIVLKKITAK